MFEESDSTIFPQQVKPVLRSHSKEDQKTFYRLMQVKRIAECQEHSAILLSCNKLHYVFKIFVFPILSGRLRRVELSHCQEN